MTYKVCDYDKVLSIELSLADAVTFAEATVMREKGFDQRGFAATIANGQGELVAVVTSRRIVGNFVKQVWGGRKGDDALHMGDESFDATDFILLMPHADLVNVEDNRDSSDYIGRKHVEWDGPHEVTIVEDICAYFGVHYLDEVTPAMLEFARERAQPRAPEVQDVELAVKVRVRLRAGASLADFTQGARCSVESGTEGIVVLQAEVQRP